MKNRRNDIRTLLHHVSNFGKERKVKFAGFEYPVSDASGGGLEKIRRHLSGLYPQKVGYRRGTNHPIPLGGIPPPWKGRELHGRGRAGSPSRPQLLQLNILRIKKMSDESIQKLAWKSEAFNVRI